MQSRTLIRSTLSRLRHPAAWGAILAFELMWILSRRVSGVSWDELGSWDFYVPALFLLGHLALAAAPWQWTGDDRPTPALWRGCLQALVWNGAWVFLLLWSVSGVVKPSQANRPEPPMRAEGEIERREPPPREWDRRPPRPEPDRPEHVRPAPDGDPVQRPWGEARVAPNPNPPPGLRQEMKLLCLNLLFALVLGWFLAGKERAESTEEELRGREQQARTLALQAQLHPHALYNVLSGLTELVHEDADAAEQAIIGMVEMLRMLTRHGSASSLPLGQERELVRRYLAIEAMRLGDRLQVVWEWPEWADRLVLPPLLLQPLVENAIKHGIAPCPEGGELWVRVRRGDGGLLLQVANTGMSWEPTLPDGTGLSNLRERLRLMPWLQAAFRIRREEGRTLAEIRIGTTLTT